MPRKVQVSHAEFADGVENARIVQSDTLEGRTAIISIVQYSTGHTSLFSESYDGQRTLFQFFAPVVPVVQRKPEGIAPGEPMSFEDSIVDQMEPDDTLEESEVVPTTPEGVQELARQNPELMRLLATMVNQAEANQSAPAPAPAPAPDPMEAALRNPVLWARMYPNIPWGGKR